MRDRPRIAIVCPLPPWTPGGIERVVAETCTRMIDSFDFTIYTTSPREEELGQRLWQGISVRVFRSPEFAYRLSIPLYRDLRKAQGLSLIHAHNYLSFIPLMSAMARSDVPLVVSPHYHTLATTRFNAMLRILYDPLLGPVALRKADLVLANSPLGGERLRSRFPCLERKVRVVLNGAPIELIRNAQPFQTDGRVLLCVARLLKYKNVDLVLRALQHLPDDYVAVVVGTGPEERNLRDLAEALGLSGRARFVGRVTDDDLFRWYRTATVLAHLSDIESFGMTCVEALAAGAAVVANDDHGGLKETIDTFQPDILPVDVKADSPESIARAIERASHIEVTANLSAFDWGSIARQLTDMYMELIAPHP